MHTWGFAYSTGACNTVEVLFHKLGFFQRKNMHALVIFGNISALVFFRKYKYICMFLLPPNIIFSYSTFYDMDQAYQVKPLSPTFNIRATTWHYSLFHEAFPYCGLLYPVLPTSNSYDKRCMSSSFSLSMVAET